jgi:hypothetical protein
MQKAMVLGPLVLLGVVGCNETPLAPIDIDAVAPRAHVGSPASSCTLAPLPATAHVLACFTTTLQPGVWHGWVLEVATAQPPGIDGNFSRTRLNHAYLLASPQGFTQWGPSDPIAPPVLFQNVFAFQAEFNGTIWWDVIRLHAAANGAPQTVPVVVYWLDATGAAGELTAAVSSLLAAGVVNGGQANALTRKVDQALALVAKGKTADAILVLQGFIQQVNDLTFSDGVLSPAQAQALIAWAQYIITAVGGGDAPAGPFTGAWSGTYSFGPMSGVLQQNGSSVTGTITDAAGCIWGVSGAASANSLSLPNWVLQVGDGVCVGASVSMSGSLDASGNTWSGSGSTALAGGGPVPWTFSLSRVSP